MLNTPIQDFEKFFPTNQTGNCVIISAFIASLNINQNDHYHIQEGFCENEINLKDRYPKLTHTWIVNLDNKEKIDFTKNQFLIKTSKKLILEELGVSSLQNFTINSKPIFENDHINRNLNSQDYEDLINLLNLKFNYTARGKRYSFKEYVDKPFDFSLIVYSLSHNLKKDFLNSTINETEEKEIINFISLLNLKEDKNVNYTDSVKHELGLFKQLLKKHGFEEENGIWKNEILRNEVRSHYNLRMELDEEIKNNNKQLNKLTFKNN